MQFRRKYKKEIHTFLQNVYLLWTFLLTLVCNVVLFRVVVLRVLFLDVYVVVLWVASLFDSFPFNHIVGGYFCIESSLAVVASWFIQIGFYYMYILIRTWSYFDISFVHFALLKQLDLWVTLLQTKRFPRSTLELYVCIIFLRYFKVFLFLYLAASVHDIFHRWPALKYSYWQS